MVSYFFPSQLPLRMARSAPHLIHGSLPIRVNAPNGIMIGLTAFAGLTIVTYGPTDRPRYSVRSNRPHLEVLRRCAILIYVLLTYLLTYLITYLLTYLQCCDDGLARLRTIRIRLILIISSSCQCL